MANVEIWWLQKQYLSPKIVPTRYKCRSETAKGKKRHFGQVRLVPVGAVYPFKKFSSFDDLGSFDNFPSFNVRISVAESEFPPQEK